MSSDRTVVIDSPVGVPSTIGGLGRKSPHLISVLGEGIKVKSVEHFITVDKPDFSVSGFVLARGFSNSSSEQAIKKSFTVLIEEAPKENIEEVYFPRERIVNVKSLVYRAK